MNYIILDTEFNQPTPPGFNPKYKIIENEECPFEIIEIGAVKLNKNLEQVDTFRLYIKPTIYKRLNPIISKKIKISNKDLNNGYEFSKAIEHFQKWIGKEYILCTWSNSDIVELINNCRYYKINYDWITNIIDIQREICKMIGREKQIGLKNALEYFNIEKDVSFHRALNDAIYETEIFKILIKEKGLSNIHHYDVEEFERVISTDRFNKKQSSEMKYIIICPECGELLSEEYHTSTKGTEKYKILGTCSKCKKRVYHLTKFKGNDRFIVTNRFISEEDYNERKEKLISNVKT
jgi:inhibitor of KinA sporulation pathway (predicted exonuclease)